MSWHPLRRWIHANEQASSAKPDEHGLRASEDIRERQRLRQALDAEIARTDPRRKHTAFYDTGSPD